MTPYRGAGRPQGVLRDGADDGRDRRRTSALDRAEVRGAQLHPARRDALRPRADLPGRPAADLRLRRLPGLAGQAQGAGRLGRLRGATAREAEREGRRVGHRPRPATSRAPASAPTRAAHVQVETSGRVNVATGLTTQGQGHQTVFAQIVADELGVPLEDVDVTTGDTRRMPYAVGTFASRAAVMSGNAVAPGRAQRCREKALRIAADALEVDPDDLEIVDGVVTVKGAPTTSIAARHGRGAVQPAALRLRRGRQGGHPVRRHGDPDKPPVAEDEEPGLEGKDFYSPTRATFANGMHAAIVETDPRHRRDQDPALLRRPRLRHADQPDDRRGPDPRRRRPGRRRRALRADGLRRVRAAAQRLVHGLPDALRLRGARRSRSTTSRRRRR